MFLDPRSKTLHWLDDTEREHIKLDVTLEAVQTRSVSKTLCETNTINPSRPNTIKIEPGAPAPELPPLPTLPGLDEDPDDTGPPDAEMNVPIDVHVPTENRHDSFFDVLFLKEETIEQNTRDLVDVEVSRYMAETTPPGIDLNPLEWWRDRRGVYPILSTLAMRYLCVPATSVPSERVFSTAGNIVSNKISQTNVNMLLFLNKNYHI